MYDGTTFGKLSNSFGLQFKETFEKLSRKSIHVTCIDHKEL